MNAMSFYMSTCRVMLTATPADKESWIDLFRLVPYLRHSLTCVVCGKLVRQPFSPQNAFCQHLVCKLCLGIKNNLRPPCLLCEDYDDFTENVSLAYLLRCYKKMCAYFMVSDMYKALITGEELSDVEGGLKSIFGLLRIVQEAAKYNDDYLDSVRLPTAPYSVAPYTASPYVCEPYVCEIGPESDPEEDLDPEDPEMAVIRDVHSPTPTVSSVYSVTYSGLGNKITIKRTAQSEPINSPSSEDRCSPIERKRSKSTYKRPSRYRSSSKRKGCRCGNATATPGKLTCCGQRCPCYVKGKACAECKCKGCRNTHVADGRKFHSVLEHDNSSTQSESNSDSADSMETLESDQNSQTSDENISLDEKDIEFMPVLMPYIEENSCSPKYFHSPKSSQSTNSTASDDSDNSDISPESPHSEDDTYIKEELTEDEANDEEENVNN